MRQVMIMLAATVAFAATGCDKGDAKNAGDKAAAAVDKAGESAKAAAKTATKSVTEVAEKAAAEKAATAKAGDKKAAPAAKPAKAAAVDAAALLEPGKLTEKAPAKFKVKFTTTKGAFVVEATREWAPLGADRFYNLVKAGFFTDVAFFRAIKGFMGQFGIHGDPKVAKAWRGSKIRDDKVGAASNKPGFLTFAKAGPDTRTTQMFINFADNARLDKMGFPPVGKVVEGMDVVNKLNTEYGEGAPRGKGPSQGRLQQEGNAYLKAEFPNLDYIKSATIL